MQIQSKDDRANRNIEIDAHFPLTSSNEGQRWLGGVTVAVIKRVLRVLRRGRSVPIVILTRLTMLGRCVVTVSSSIFVEIMACLSSTALRLPDFAPVIANIGLVIRLLISVVGYRRCEGGGSRKQRMRLEGELWDGRALGYLGRGKFGIETVRESIIGRERGGQIGDLVSCDRKSGIRRYRHSRPVLGRGWRSNNRVWTCRTR